MGFVVSDRFRDLANATMVASGQQLPSLCLVAAHCAYVRPTPPCRPHRPVLACACVRLQASPEPGCLCHERTPCVHLTCMHHVCAWTADS